jgi:hypothetical protein
VQQGMAQLARGEFTEYDDQSLSDLFDGLKQRALNREPCHEPRP